MESLGGAHAPWTSKRGPQSEAQAGRVENGTISPSGDATAAPAVVVVVAIFDVGRWYMKMRESCIQSIADCNIAESFEVASVVILRRAAGGDSLLRYI